MLSSKGKQIIDTLCHTLLIGRAVLHHAAASNVQTTFLIHVNALLSVFVGPCHHGMARPLVTDGGTASNMDGSCE